jgi:hypothetical protein
VRTQGRRPVCGGRRRGDWREAGRGAADAGAEPGTAPPSLRPKPERRLRGLRAEREWGREQKMRRRCLEDKKRRRLSGCVPQC